MANPFGGFGGQQIVMGSCTQQQQTSPLAGSTAPVFEQHAFGETTSTSTSAFTSNIFHRNVSKSSPQSGLFSSMPTCSAASTSASSSVFGKPSVFGQNVSQLSNQLGVFSNQSDNSSTGAAKSAFGQVFVFGQTSITKNVLGSLTSGADTSVQSRMFQGKTARTTRERVHMLELRDKFIRQNRRTQKKNIKTAKVIVGTCPDMCPEKERYDREDKCRLSHYEIVPFTENVCLKLFYLNIKPGCLSPQVDHSRAVKEYIHSWSDQEEPLPHEVRPIQVLLSTMTYLLTEVADKGEDGHWGYWFDFLWNRTMAIRKDIAQQQLNDHNAVDLIEKCARFHIYCSERLCEETMHTFNAKFNDENLTRCLQTLKEFYVDLEKKQKCLCENEAEFRAYMILMNLNEGDTLREVQQLRPVVRTSLAVKFALQTYFALDGNNYIKFFRLVKQASYTNACIMHRYFMQVRSKALKMMREGYSMGFGPPAQIPLHEMVRLLGFDCEKEASDFCQNYGCSIKDRDVILHKYWYIKPKTMSPRRSVNLIESRLMVSVGELINGEVLKNVLRLTPVSSFNKKDKFWSTVPLPIKSPKPGASIRPAEERPEAVVKEKARISVEVLKDTAKFLFWDVIEAMCQDIGFEVKSEVDCLLLLSEEFMHKVLNAVLYEEMRELKAQLKQECFERSSDDINAELVEEVKNEMVADMSENVFETDMSVPADNAVFDWQAEKALVEACSYMLKSEVATDVEFSVGEQQTTVRAHKFMLICRSSVFQAMFTHDNVDSRQTVKIPDIEPDIFYKLLTYMYTEETNITERDVLPLLYTARKYSVHVLVHKCLSFLSKRSPENICDI